MSPSNNADIEPVLNEFCRAVDEGNTPFLMRALSPEAAVSMSGLRVRPSQVARDQPHCGVLDEAKAGGIYDVSFALGNVPWIKTRWVYQDDSWVIADAYKI